MTAFYGFKAKQAGSSTWSTLYSKTPSHFEWQTVFAAGNFRHANQTPAAINKIFTD